MGKGIGQCPKCGQQMEQGFCPRTAGLSYIKPERFQHLAFRDEDLLRAGFRKLLPFKAEFYVAYLCSQCKLIFVDFSKGLNRKEANKLVSAD